MSDPGQNAQRAQIEARFEAAQKLYRSGDHAQAARMFDECAAQGHAPSAMELALMLLTGRHLPPDPARGRQLLLRSAESGYPLGMYNYSVAVMNGEYPETPRE